MNPGRPKVRSLLAGLLMIVVLVPLAAITLTRVVDNQIVRRTEVALLSEAAAIGEFYRQMVQTEALSPLPPPRAVYEDRFSPFYPAIDLRRQALLQPAERAGTSTTPASRVARHMVPLLERIQVRNLSGVRVLDDKGTVIASPLPQVGYSLSHLPEVQAALEGRYAPQVRRKMGNEPRPPLSSLSRAAALRVALAIPIYANPRAEVNSGEAVIGVIYNSRTPLDRLEYLWEVRHELYRPALITIIITLAIALLLSFVIARPLSRLKKAAVAVAAGDHDQSLEVRGFAPFEVHALSDSLATMRAQLEARTEYVSRFATNTAHELKTPLTSLRGAAELILDDENMPPEQLRRFIGNIHKDAVRMDQLVQSILRLARIEAGRPQRETLDLAASLEAVVERYKRRDLDVSLQYQAANRIIDYAPDQLESLVSNLLDNAVRHGAGKPVQLSVVDTDLGRKMTVRDHGPSMSPEHFRKIFDRFYTTERSRGGTGLGLSIARAIVESHGGHIKAVGHDEGASFIVHLESQA